MCLSEHSSAGHVEPQLQLIRDRWRALGVTVRDGASAACIADFESRYRIQMPFALRQFYELMDGMEVGETDEELNSFWPLHDVGTVPEKLSDFRGTPDYGGIEHILPEAASYFVFADHSIWLQVYAVRLSTHGDRDDVYAICGKLFERIAPSFADFLGQYAKDPKAVMYPTYGEQSAKARG
jgi:hypothetical protein